MPGTARRIAIVVLSVLLVVLVIIAVVVFSNSRQPRAGLIVNGASCQAGAAAQCESASAGGNTGQLCSCEPGTNGSYVWNCSQLDLASCPLSGAVSCQPDEQQVGSCGGAGCLATQKPVQICGADGTYGQTTCITDSSCESAATSSAPGINCEINGGGRTLTITNACPTDFSYLVQLHVVESSTATTDSDCATAFDPNAQTFSGSPGGTFEVDPDDYTCGLCVRYELTQTPQSAFIRSTSAFAFTGLCEVTTTSSITSSAVETTTSSTETSETSTSISSATSSSSSTLPSTGLFDDAENLPLLFGLTLILVGLSVNRVWWLWRDGKE